MATDDIEMKDQTSGFDGDEVGAADGVMAPPQPVLLLDALPYLDTEYGQNPHLQEQVKQLIHEEMSSLSRTPDEYLQDFLQTRTFQEQYMLYETPLLTAAFASLSSSTPQPSGLDLTRYKLDAPAAGSDEASWRAAIDNAQAQLEHQTNRAVNLELLKKFGATAWKKHNEQLTHLKNTLASSLSGIQSESEVLNRKRKSEQVALGHDLQLLDNAYYSLVWKNHEIEHACYQLQKKLPAGADNNGTHATKLQKTSE